MGGDHGGHGHGHGIKIPDYRIYRVEDVPQLLKVQEALARRGLRDPWLRNEVWRYNPDLGTRPQRIKLVFFRGFKYGLGLCVLSILGDHLYKYINPPTHHHGHH